MTRWPGPSPRARGAHLVGDRTPRPGGTIPACAGSTDVLFVVGEDSRDHPRVRGEHLAEGLDQPCGLGPSPRARGAQGPPGPPGRAARTIPACAGSTRPRWTCTTWPRDHPRVRGEHTVRQPWAWAIPGPSPRARGALHLGRVQRVADGTIPACAGSTVWGLAAGRGVRGPSPRARGAQDLAPCDQIARGTIPACAGSTPPHTYGLPAWRDHPRVRGEHRPRPTPRRRPAGPSPRARGALAICRRPALQQGTIPACAGSTGLRHPRKGNLRDHPRVRGEHGIPWSRIPVFPGPSPRARGAHRRGRRSDPRCGTIPACAGSTSARPPSSRSGRDHPRVRGEHLGDHQVPGALQGPSPRARGARVGGGLVRLPVRTIPACAGSTRPRWTCTTWPRDHPRVRGEHNRG